MLDLLAYIGRFQPFHTGHLRVILYALTLTKRLVICIGSATGPRTLRNPWTFNERVQIIKNSLHPSELGRVDFQPISDHTYNDPAWVVQVERAVESTAWNYRVGNDYKIGLVGHIKDKSSEYQNLFRTWNPINAPFEVIYNATDIRQDYFSHNPKVPSVPVAPQATRDFLEKFCDTKEFQHLVAEQKWNNKHLESWAGSPYPPVFVTVDNLITQSNMILLIERKSMPGKGMLAMPGGYIDQGDRSLLDAAIRELKEETRLKIPEDALRGSLKKVEVFADPHRSARGRIITHVHQFTLNPAKELPKANGRTDAKRAFWMPISELKEVEFFEDHFHIINSMLGLNLITG